MISRYFIQLSLIIPLRSIVDKKQNLYKKLILLLFPFEKKSSLIDFLSDKYKQKTFSHTLQIRSRFSLPQIFPNGQLKTLHDAHLNGTV